MSVLQALGLDEIRRQEAASAMTNGAVLGRVVRVDRGMASLETEDGPLRVDNVAEPFLTVGDWALIGQTTVRLERRTELVRRSGYRRDARQIMAANVDAILVVRALDTEVRVNRLSTLVVIAHESGAVPLVVLTKADESPSVDAACEMVREGLPGVEVMAVSVTSGYGLPELRDWVRNKTVVLLGESGAGKSTLTNWLLGEEHLLTTAVRRDGQGRHTTTHRELVVIPGGGVVIDTPGIREAAAFGEGEGVELAFADLAELAGSCRFSDCSHRHTPGCAIEAAVNDGTVDETRVAQFLEELEGRAWIAERLELRARAAKRGRRR
ncbi:MAG: ribosome small subunit-dependent GTPase A [Actinomycetota bacterium]